jgi:hypothetical protein
MCFSRLVRKDLDFSVAPTFSGGPDAGALLQEMSAERNNRITRAQSRDHGGLVGHPNKPDRLKAYG